MTQQIRMTAPPQRSSLAFACWAQEYFNFHDEMLLKDVTPLDTATLSAEPAESEDPRGAHMLAYYDQAATDLRWVYGHMARSRLSFLAPRLLASEAGQRLVDGTASLLAENGLLRDQARALRLQLAAHSQRGQLSRRALKSHRRRVVDVTAGAYFSLGDARRTRIETAKLLNRGLPAKDKRTSGVNDDHVRNALDTVARVSFRHARWDKPGVSDCLDVFCCQLVYRWRLLDRLWLRAEEWSRPGL